MRTCLVVLALVAACHKESAKTEAAPTAPKSTTDADALWALAPDGATLGIVATPRAIAMADHAVADVRAAFKAAPELAPLAAQVDSALTEAFGSPTGHFADAGIAPAKGGALFVVPGGKTIFVVPLGDRDKFLAKVHGTKGKDEDKADAETCKTLRGYYVCVDSPELFARVGKGDLEKQLGKLGTRGEIEVIATDIPVMDAHVTALGAVQLARGAATVHATVLGLPPALTSRFGTPVKPRVDPKDAGFASVDLSAFLEEVPPLPLVAGVTLADVAHAIGGPLTITFPSGAFDFDLRVPLSSTAPVQTLLQHCADLPPLAALGATSTKGSCRLTVPLIGTTLEASVEGVELRIEARTPGQKTGGGVEMTAPGKQIAGEPWTFAFWGRGTFYAAPALPIPSLQSAPEDTQLGFRIFTLIDELGFAVRVEHQELHAEVTARTIWANPDGVVAKLAAIPTDDVIHGRAGSAASAIASGASGSPFAADYKAGVAGLAAPVSVLGILAAVAVPAFLDYTHKAKHNEAELELNRIGRNLKEYYADNGSLPKGDAPLTPATSCCQGPEGKCAADPAQWNNPIWRALAFEIYDPHLFRYSYHSDGKTATALAVGDLDCDGTAITYRLDVAPDPTGNLSVTLTEPPPNSD